MTLTKFKSNFKAVVVVSIFSLYSLSVFLMGQKSAIFNFQRASIAAPKQEASIIQKPLPANDTQTAQVLSSYIKLCSNTTDSFEVAYPKDWFTTYNQKEEECTYFAPYSFVLPASPDPEFTPITIKIIDKDEWEDTVKSYQSPSEIYNIVTTKNVQINDKSVKYIEAQSTGNLKPKGFVKVTYLIPDANKPMEISYSQIDEKEDVQGSEDALKNIVQSLKYF